MIHEWVTPIHHHFLQIQTFSANVYTHRIPLCGNRLLSQTALSCPRGTESSPSDNKFARVFAYEEGCSIYCTIQYVEGEKTCSLIYWKKRWCFHMVLSCESGSQCKFATTPNSDLYHLE